jgi:hypothetical protein
MELTGLPMLVYGGAAATGTLLCSIAPAAGTDAFGNVFRKSITSYNAGTSEFAQLGDGFITLQDTAANNWQLVAFLVSGTPYLALEAQSTGPVLFIDQGGRVIPEDPTNPGIPETWHSLGTLANYTVNAGRYRLTPTGETELDVNVVSAGANAASTAFSNTLPAVYRPTSINQTYPLSNSKAIAAGDTMPRLVAATNGVVSVVQTASVSATLGGQAFVPLN